VIARGLCRWMYREAFDSEIAAARGYDSAIRRMNIPDAELCVNFRGGQTPARAHRPSWDTMGGAAGCGLYDSGAMNHAEDVQVCRLSLW
jgi:hypothetical protein